MPCRIIIDTDIGDDIDDAYAIALALKSPEIELAGITTVYGKVRERARLALKLLQIFGKKDVPVIVGSADPLKGKGPEAVPCQYAALKPDESLPSPADVGAVDFIISRLLENPGEITLVPIGALTNVAGAISKEPALKEKLKGIMMMGGVVAGEKAEWNMKCDPEAAQVIFSSGIPVTMVGLDVTMKCRLSAEEMSRLEKSDKPDAKFLMELTRLWQEHFNRPYLVLHDPLAVAVFINPALVRTRRGTIEVELRDGPSRGATRFKPDDSGTVQVALEVERDKFVSLFLERITG